MQYKSLAENQYYIDKTEALEKGITVFPSIYIEGAAACGKTTAVKMLLARHPEAKAGKIPGKTAESGSEKCYSGKRISEIGTKSDLGDSGKYQKRALPRYSSRDCGIYSEPSIPLPDDSGGKRTSSGGITGIFLEKGNGTFAPEGASLYTAGGTGTCSTDRK